MLKWYNQATKFEAARNKTIKLNGISDIIRAPQSLLCPNNVGYVNDISQNVIIPTIWTMKVKALHNFPVNAKTVHFLSFKLKHCSNYTLKVKTLYNL